MQDNSDQIFASLGCEYKNKILIQYGYRNKKWRIRDRLQLRRLSQAWRIYFDKEITVLQPTLNLIEKPHVVNQIGEWLPNIENLDLRNCSFHQNSHVVAQVVEALPQFRSLNFINFGKSLQDIFQWKSVLQIDRDILDCHIEQQDVLQGIISDSKEGYSSILLVLSSLAKMGLRLCMDASIYSTQNLRRLIEVANQSGNITLRLKLFVSCAQADVQQWFLQGKKVIQSIDVFQCRALMRGRFLQQMLQDNDVLMELRFRAPHRISQLKWEWSQGEEGEIEKIQVLEGFQRLKNVAWDITKADNAQMLSEIPYSTCVHLYNLDVVQNKELQNVKGLRKLSLICMRTEYSQTTCQKLQQQLQNLPELRKIEVLFCELWKYVDLSCLYNLTSLSINSTWMLSDNVKQQDLEFLHEMVNLEDLNLQIKAYFLISNFDFLKNLRKLRNLQLGGVQSVTFQNFNVCVFQNLKSLEQIVLKVRQEQVSKFELALTRAFPSQNVKYTFKLS